MTLVVTRVVGLVTVQDLGRCGHMHEAVPPGGALVPALLVAANRHASNRDDAPAIEVMGQLDVRAGSPIVVATPEASHTLAAGEVHVVRSEPRRATYLAIRGGVDAPLVLGGRGTLLCAGLGAVLQKHDRIEPTPADPVTSSGVVRDDRDHDRAIRVIAGPDELPADALATLLSAEYRISPSSDRVGTRLDGPRLPVPDGSRSRPMVIGAIEVPRDGAPIVLGPEHPVTGGYPIVAVVARDDVGALFSIALGGRVRFALG